MEHGTKLHFHIYLTQAMKDTLSFFAFHFKMHLSFLFQLRRNLHKILTELLFRRVSCILKSTMPL